jgi:hypothetical protein
MPRPIPAIPEPDLAELLRQCLGGLMLQVPALANWLDRYEVRK